MIHWKEIDDALGAVVSAALKAANLPAVRERKDVKAPLVRRSYRIDVGQTDGMGTDDYAETGRTFVISTHILEEASNVFEKVLIMKEGRLIEACDADELLAQFCAVTGRDDVVNEACAGLNILHTETLGRQKSCVVRVPAETMAAKGLDVDCTSLPLQKVFVALCGHEQELQEHREG